VFAALSDGATIDTPMESNFFSSRFGSLTDRFGVSWMVTVVPANERVNA
jgi:PhnB protein